MKKNGFAQLIIVLVIAILGVIGYFVYKNIQRASSSQSTTFQTVNTKQYLTKGAASKSDFPKLSFTYPVSWQVKEDIINTGMPQDDVTISKGQYSVSITQEILSGGSMCSFVNPPLTSTSVTNYKEMDSNLGRIRYFENPNNDDKTTKLYYFCVMDNNKIYQDSPVGYISTKTPLNSDATIFAEALDIVKSIKPLQ
jgi:type II secretory pathway pseudopilin PulG